MTGDDGTPIGVPLVGFTTISDKTLERQEPPCLPPSNGVQAGAPADTAKENRHTTMYK